MRNLLQLAAALLITATTATHAQIINPDKLTAPAPRNPATPRPTTAADYQWLWQYATPSDKPRLMQDPRFTALLADNLKAPQAMWGRGVPLSEAAAAFLAGEGVIASADNRHLTITGCIIDHCPQRGLLYADLGERDPLIVFLALRWNEQTRTTDEPHAPFTLWLFPSRELDPAHLPSSVKDAVANFTSGGCNAPTITNAIIVDPTGIPHIIGALDAGVLPAFCNPTSGTHL